MLTDGSGAAPAAGTDQQASIGLSSSSAGPQEAALHLLANLMQVCTCPPLCTHLKDCHTSALMQKQTLLSHKRNVNVTQLC